jgi:hypothetical protein
MIEADRILRAITSKIISYLLSVPQNPVRPVDERRFTAGPDVQISNGE